MRARSVLLPVALAVVTAACGDEGGTDGGTSSPPASISHPEGANELVVRVASGGGLIPDQVRAAEIPEWSLYGDGTLVATGPQMEIYPQPALPNLLRRRISEEGMQAILHAAYGAGLLSADRRLSATDATDLWVTTLTVNAGGKTHTTSVYGLGFRPPAGAPSPPKGDAAAIEMIQAFSNKTSDLTTWLPGGSVGPAQPYRPDAMRVYIFPYQPPTDPKLTQQEMPWPLPSLVGKPTDIAPCLVVTGPDLNTLLPLAEKANQLTPWIGIGPNRNEAHGLVFRPLLPDESGC